MSLLTAEDYKNIIGFTNFINHNYDVFIDSVLTGITEYFGFRLVVYTVFGRDANDDLYVEDIYSNNVQESLLNDYESHIYKTDMFTKAVIVERHNNTVRKHLTIEDITTNEKFFSTPYGQQLHKNNLGSQIVIMGQSAMPAPSHVVNIFKSLPEGGFTPYEKELFNEISDAFNQSLMLYKQHIEIANYEKLLGCYTETTGDGLCILDDDRKITYYNKRFLNFITKNIGHYNLNHTISILIDLIDKELGTPFEKLGEETMVEVCDSQLGVNYCRIYTGESWENFLFLRHKSQLPILNRLERHSEINEQYNLSPREMEVAGLIVQGMDNAQIGDELCINISTVKFHIKNIFTKLEVNNRAAVVAKMLIVP